MLFLEGLAEQTDRENEKLKKQVETLTQELEAVKAENEQLKTEVQNVDLTHALTQALERMGATVPQSATDSPSEPVDPEQTTFDDLNK